MEIPPIVSAKTPSPLVQAASGVGSRPRMAATEANSAEARKTLAPGLGKAGENT